LYATASREFSKAIDRLAAGYEADPEKRHDLRQDIHFQLWRSLEAFDERCSLKTWTFRVAHNTAVSYIDRERRKNATFVTLEEIEITAPGEAHEPDIDQQRALRQLAEFIRQLKPLPGDCGLHTKVFWSLDSPRFSHGLRSLCIGFAAGFGRATLPGGTPLP